MLENALMIPGPQGQLEALWHPVEEGNRVGVICHPHPLYQGTMHNKVVNTLARAFYHSGISAVRFNYRGVGNSEGTYGHSVGEVEDLLAVMAWVKSRQGAVQFYLAGFSFGAYIAAAGAACEECVQLLSVAPAVTHQPYLSLPAISCPWIVLQGEEDETISPQAVYDWVEQTKSKHADLHLIKIPGATHFFHGQLTLLRTLIEEQLVK